MSAGERGCRGSSRLSSKDSLKSKRVTGCERSFFPKVIPDKTMKKEDFVGNPRVIVSRCGFNKTSWFREHDDHSCLTFDVCVSVTEQYCH